MRSLLLVTVLLLVATTASTGEPPAADAASFNEAWQAFVNVRESGDTALKRGAASRVLEIGREILPPDDERLPALIANYGVILLEDNDPEAARDVFDEALELAEAIYGKKSEALISYLEKAAEASAQSGGYKRQKSLLRRAVKIAGAHFGRDSLEYGDLALKAGVSIMASGHSLDGRGFVRDADEIFLTHPDAGTKRRALSALWLGKVAMAQRQNRNATEYLLRALDGFEAADEPMTLHELATHGHLIHVYEERGMSAAATKHCLAIGARRPDRRNAELTPLFRIAPKYPTDMLRLGRQGYVEISLTVDEQGFVRDPVVTDREGGKSFEAVALEAVRGFRYAPKFENGEPVAVSGVTTRVTFSID